MYPLFCTFRNSKSYKIRGTLQNKGVQNKGYRTVIEFLVKKYFCHFFSLSKYLLRVQKNVKNQVENGQQSLKWLMLPHGLKLMRLLDSSLQKNLQFFVNVKGAGSSLYLNRCVKTEFVKRNFRNGSLTKKSKTRRNVTSINTSKTKTMKMFATQKAQLWRKRKKSTLFLCPLATLLVLSAASGQSLLKSNKIMFKFSHKIQLFNVL